MVLSSVGVAPRRSIILHFGLIHIDLHAFFPFYFILSHGTG